MKGHVIYNNTWKWYNEKTNKPQYKVHNYEQTLTISLSNNCKTSGCFGNIFKRFKRRPLTEVTDTVHCKCNRQYKELRQMSPTDEVFTPAAVLKLHRMMTLVHHTDILYQSKHTGNHYNGSFSGLLGQQKHSPVPVMLLCSASILLAIVGVLSKKKLCTFWRKHETLHG